MQIIYQEPPKPLANVTSIIEAVKLDPADLDQIHAVRERLATITAVESRCQPDSPNQLDPNWRCYWHLEFDRLLGELGSNPSDEAAEAATTAFLRWQQASLTHPPIRNVMAAAVAAASRSLEPVALRVIDRAEQNLKAEADEHRATLTKTGGLFGADSIAALEAKTASLFAALDSERDMARADGGHWLFTRGFGMPPAPPAPTPQPLPPVKQPARGKVEITKRDPLEIEQIFGPLPE